MSTGTDPADPLVTAFGQAQHLRNGLPDDALRADRVRCRELIHEVLGDDVGQGDVVVSPLGVEWTEVFDVRTRRQVPAERLAEAGWLPLDSLLGGHTTARRKRRAVPQRWAVVEGGRVLAGMRLSDGPVDPVQAVLDSCRERAEVRLREVLELRALRQQGRPFPLDAPPLRAAAEIESGLGGRLLAPWATGRAGNAPVALRNGRRGVVVAVSGVDGSGKSTLRTALADSLERAGVPVSTVWVRPGMGLGPLIRLAAWGKRLLRQDAAPGLRAMADPDAVRPASRRGAVGWIWAFLVTVSFLVGVWRQHRSTRGVVLYDRHLVDALATLDFAYGGVDLRLQRRLIRVLLPRAEVRLYLDVPAEVSVARKPDDLLGEHAVRRQLEEYERWLDRLPPAARLDATLATAVLVGEAIRVITARRNANVSASGHERPSEGDRQG
jgi:thymidylate kinase